MKLEKDEHDWKSWLFPTGYKTYVFPVKIQDWWMVYKPDSNDYVIVQDREYMTAYNEGKLSRRGIHD